jgi:hypothetical protein
MSATTLSRVPRQLIAAALGIVLPLAALHAAEPKPAADKIKEIAGTAEFLRAIPKHFAALQAADPARRRVTLLIEGEKEPKEWELTPDAEVKVLGWWGRLEQFVPGDRVWAWFAFDRQKKPTAVLMLADEISAQDIHGQPDTLEREGDGRVTLKPAKGPNRTLTATAGVAPPGSKVYVQSAGDRARTLLTAAGFEEHRARQKAWLRQRWLDEGLPGTVSFVHRLSGEMELMLDHEAMRWGRSLKTGDSVTLAASPPVPAVVRDVRPWRERTQVRLVAGAADLGEFTNGQRTHLKMPAPPAEVESSVYPPDADRPRSKAERVEWVLASVYCTCGVPNDTCTGHFYTLASCNPNGCGMPGATRQKLAGLIDQGLTDKQIFDVLLRERGKGLLRPHLLP